MKKYYTMKIILTIETHLQCDYKTLIQVIQSIYSEFDSFLIT